MAGVDLVLREGTSDSSTENELQSILPPQNGELDRAAHLLHDHLQLLIKERLFNHLDEWFVNCAYSGFLITKVRSFAVEERVDFAELRVATKQWNHSLENPSLESPEIHFRDHQLGLEDGRLYG